MDRISLEYGLALNILNAMKDHKLHCNTNCNVSLFQLGEAAKYILRSENIRTGRDSQMNLDLVIEIDQAPK